VNTIAVVGIGVRAPGLSNWAQAAAILCGDAAYEWAELPRFVPSALPMTERRRANETSRLAIAATEEAMSNLPREAIAEIPLVFASADGDGIVLAEMLAALATPDRMVSPTIFHNSVFNAPAGYWAIGAHAQAASTAVCAGPASFAAGLMEAWAQVASSDRPACLIAVDIPFPSALHGFGGGSCAFACALLIAPDRLGLPVIGGRISNLHVTAGAIEALPASPALAQRFAGNAAAAALPLLENLSRCASGAIALPYLDDRCLRIETAP
jgi:Beta-ketoacyl synthase, N-terminal domain